MLSFPNAKLNLGLHITEKRADGYHNLESCFYPVSWMDVLEIIEAPELKFTSSGMTIPGEGHNNLCVKAYHSLKKNFDLPPVHIHLHKAIPIGAGLGGGSADATFTIKLLNEKFELNLSVAQMEEYARPIGSDCAFFVQNQPRYCYDKGDRFEAISVPLKGYFAVLVYPNIHVSTGDAYAGIRPKLPKMPLKQVLNQPIREWRYTLVNDFEEGVFARHGILFEIKEKLYELGAVYAAMSGSGSTVFGVFEKELSLNTLFPADYLTWTGRL